MQAAICLPLKPISTNKLYTGRRWKSAAAKQFEKDIALHLLAACRDRTLPDGELAIHFQFGTSRRMDVSNCVKLVEDCIARHFGIDDRRFTAQTVVRVPVKKGQEFITFRITPYRAEDFPALLAN